MRGGELLKTLRLLRGYTQGDVAALYGAGERTYQRWESCSTKIPFDDLYGIVTCVFQLSMSEALDKVEHARH